MRPDLEGIEGGKDYYARAGKRSYGPTATESHISEKAARQHEQKSWQFQLSRPSPVAQVGTALQENPVSDICDQIPGRRHDP